MNSVVAIESEPMGPIDDKPNDQIVGNLPFEETNDLRAIAVDEGKDNLQNNLLIIN